MNKKQREIIADAYRTWHLNNKQCDPVGGYMDMKDMFDRLSDTDPKLAEEMKEAQADVYDE